MLILGRKVGEEIVVTPAGIRIIISKIRGDGKNVPYVVKLAIEGPRKENVWRREVFDKEVAKHSRSAVRHAKAAESGNLSAINTQTEGLSEGSTERSPC